MSDQDLVFACGHRMIEVGVGANHHTERNEDGAPVSRLDLVCPQCREPLEPFGHEGVSRTLLVAQITLQSSSAAVIEKWVEGFTATLLREDLVLRADFTTTELTQ